jgi:hypothetical protein
MENRLGGESFGGNVEIREYVAGENPEGAERLRQGSSDLRGLFDV